MKISSFSFELKEESEISLRVFNILGEEIGTIFDGKMHSGLHRFIWNANVNSGVYFYRLDVNSYDGFSSSITKKMILLK